MTKEYIIGVLLFAVLYAGGTSACLAEPESPEPAIVPTLEPQCAVPFRDNAVFQQKIPLPVWGTTLPGAKVTVIFDGQTKTVKADQDGKWRVVLDPIQAVKLKTVNDAPEGKTMTVSCEKDGEKAVQEIKNIIMGDVWLGAGQSNMAGKLGSGASSRYATNDIAAANYPGLRQLVSPEPKWVVCSPETVSEFKKVCFFFARRVHEKALVPVGIINAAQGGSKIESWLNKEPYEFGRNYTTKVAPIVGYGIRGVIWYQGESNAGDKRGYQPKLESLITGWREVWGQPPSTDAGVPGSDFPFYFVQLPGIGKSPADNPAMGDGRAEIRQACVECLAITNTGLAVTIDIGAPGEHPPNKVDTGDRLARLALHNVYGMKDVAVCPLYKGYKTEGDSIRISFENAESGLMLALKDGFSAPSPTPDAKLGWLSIQDKEGKWHWADGRIDGSELVVSCSAVKEPRAVRYAYTIQPSGPLLYSKEGLPVGPFSTDGYGPAEEKDGEQTEAAIQADEK